MKPLWDGLFRKNPVLVLALGLVPAVAVTTTAMNGLALGLLTVAIWLAATIVSKAAAPYVPVTARTAVRLLILIVLVVCVYAVLLRRNPSLVASLGIFLPLIAVNDLLLRAGREEQGMKEALLNTLGQGLGFALALLVLGMIREFLGYGSLFGTQILSGRLAPLSLASTVPGGMIILGLVMAVVNLVSKQGGELHE